VTKCKRFKERIAEVTLTLSQPTRYRILVSLKLLHSEPNFHQAGKKMVIWGLFCVQHSASNKITTLYV